MAKKGKAIKVWTLLDLDKDELGLWCFKTREAARYTKKMSSGEFRVQRIRITPLPNAGGRRSA